MQRTRRILTALCAAVGVLLLIAAARPAAAQSVSPVIMEYRGSAVSGSFDIANDSLLPLVVTIEPKSFTIDRDGRGQFRALDASIHVQFSEASLRLPPHSRRTVYYKAAADVYPAWFSVYAMFHGLPRQNGMNVQLELPHTVYLLGDRKRSQAARGDLAFSELHLDGRTLTGLVSNPSAKMLRVDSLEIAQPGHARQQAGGFPLLPGGAHAFSMQMAAADAPASIEARFAGLKLSAAVPMNSSR